MVRKSDEDIRFGLTSEYLRNKECNGYVREQQVQSEIYETLKKNSTGANISRVELCL